MCVRVRDWGSSVPMDGHCLVGITDTVKLGTMQHGLTLATLAENTPYRRFLSGPPAVTNMFSLLM